MDKKDTFPTIEQSLKMIEEELKARNKGKSDSKTFRKNTGLLKENGKIRLPLSNLFKKNDDVLLLTKKIDNKGKVIDFKKKENLRKKLKNKPKEKIKKIKDKEFDLNIKDYKNLKKTNDLAVIIKKLKNIRDKILNKKKKSKEINKEIEKLNETIDLAEDLFKKELLDL
jgi:hypothetical protein